MVNMFPLHLQASILFIPAYIDFLGQKSGGAAVAASLSARYTRYVTDTHSRQRCAASAGTGSNRQHSQ